VVVRPARAEKLRACDYPGRDNTRTVIGPVHPLAQRRSGIAGCTRNWACFPRAAKAQLPARDSGRARPAGVLPRCASAAAERKTSGSLAPQTQLDGHWASGSIVPLAQVGCSAAGPVGASPHWPRVIGIRRGNRGGEKTYRKSGN
jgi:hypothetical protein